MALMFTGLVEELAAVEAARQISAAGRIQALKLAVKAPTVAKDAKDGDSIAVSGCCLTIVKKERNLLHFDVGSESLSCTNFSRLKKGSRVNLERSLKLGDRLGGHLVTGHIDGQATLVERRDEGEWSHFTFRADRRLMRQMASKGSISIDGVSLTLVTVKTDRFS